MARAAIVPLLSIIACVLGLTEAGALHIRPQACRNFGGQIGTCMFVWECIKTEGKHLGTCVDGFLFGSCCAHNETSNIVGGSPSVDDIHVRPTSATGAGITYPVHQISSTLIDKATTVRQTTEVSVSTRNPVSAGTDTATVPSVATTSEKPRPFYPTHSNAGSSFKPATWSFTGRPSTTNEFSSTSPSTSVSGPFSWQHPGPVVSDRPYFPPRPTWEPYVSSTHQTALVSTGPVRPNTPNQNTATQGSTGLTLATTQKHSLFSQSSTTHFSLLDFLNRNYTPSTTPATTKWTTLQSVTFSLPASQTASFLSTVTFKPGTSTRFPSRPTWKPVVVTGVPPGRPVPTLLETSTQSSAIDLSTSETKTSTAKSKDCGIQNPHPQQKVVGGKNSVFGSWPWQASVRRTSFFGFSSTHRCGGALISRQWVATAGHCVDDLLLSQIKIRVGEYDFSSVQEPHGYVEKGVKKKVVHPRYNFFTYENDLALVQLEEAIDPDKYPHIGPICLPPSEEDLVGKNATVTGWGRLSEGGVLPSILQEVQVPIISNEKCKNMFLAAGRHEYIPDIFMCAGFEEGGRDSCQGDSGGPLQIQDDDGHWFLAGIISWGIGCAEPNMPGVCTRISKFKEWVLQNIT